MGGLGLGNWLDMISPIDIYVSYIKEMKMARMTRTIISLPADEKKWLEKYGRHQRISSAEVVRRAIREFQRMRGEKGPSENSVREDRSAYGPPLTSVITDVRELTRRAIEAAGRFESGVPDLSVGHDRYLADEKVADEHATDGRGKGRKTSDGSGRDGGTR